MNKAHTISDSDSDEEILAPLSKRLFPGLDPDNIQPNSCPLVEKFPEKQTTDNLSGCAFNVSKAFTGLKSGRTVEDTIERTAKATGSNDLKHNTIVPIDTQLDRIRKKDDVYQKKQQQVLQREQRKKELAEKEKIKEYENAKKRTMREAYKTAKPGEAIKCMTVMLDPAILKCPAGTAILDILQKHDICYEIQPQVLPGIITFWREVTEIVEKEPLHLETKKKEVIEDEILLVVPLEKFVSLVSNYKKYQSNSSNGEMTLKQHIEEVRTCLEERKVTLIVQDMTKYFKEQEVYSQRKNSNNKKKKVVSTVDISVSRMDVEEALVDAQLHTGCNVRFVASNEEMAKSVLQFTKAVADAPFKRERLQNGLSLYISGTGTVKISRDGHGVQQAWRQQLMQFRNVKAEVANAIMSHFKSPLELWKAYENCCSVQEAESLLQDIVIRRGVGVMATSRRIGKELSRRLFLLFTSDDPDVALT